MAMTQEPHATSADYWGLPEGRKVEPVEGKSYDIALRASMNAPAWAECWTVYPAHRRTTAYRSEHEGIPVVYPFGVEVPVGIWEGELPVEVGALP